MSLLRSRYGYKISLIQAWGNSPKQWAVLCPQAFRILSSIARVSLRTIQGFYTDIPTCTHPYSQTHTCLQRTRVHLPQFSSFLECYLQHFGTAKSQHFIILVCASHSQRGILSFPKRGKSDSCNVKKCLLFLCIKHRLCLQYTSTHIHVCIHPISRTIICSIKISWEKGFKKMHV